MTGAHTFSIVWHNDNGGAKVHMRQSRCAHGQRGNSLSSASLSPYQEGQYYARNPSQLWVQVDVRGAIKLYCFEAVMLCRSRATGRSIFSAVFGNISIVAFQSRQQQCETVLQC